MEFFWLIMGVSILIFAGYSYATDQHTEDIKYFFMAGAMAVVLSIFRIVYRNHTPK